MSDKHGGSTPEEYEETVDPDNPPNSTTGAAGAVAGMWYYLGPIALVALLLLLAMFYRFDVRDARDPSIAPTTGTSEEVTPGGGDPHPRPGSTEDEIEYRGGGNQQE